MTMKPILSGLALKIVAVVGAGVAAAATQLPDPWKTPVAIAGCILSALSGLAAPSPEVTAGKPILQGTLATSAATVAAVIQNYMTTLPPTWQALAGGILALLAYLTGSALPQLGSTHPKEQQ